MVSMPTDKTVYIIEDDATVQFLLKTYLTGKWDVKSSYSAEEAARYICVDAPDIVLTDYNLPGMNGLELFEKMRATLPKTRFVMMTSMDDSTIREKAIKAGFDGFMQKPIKRNALLTELEYLAA